MNTTIENLPVGTTLQLQGKSCRDAVGGERPVDWTITKRVCDLINEERWICDSTGRWVEFHFESKELSESDHRVLRVTERNNWYVAFCSATVIS